MSSEMAWRGGFFDFGGRGEIRESLRKIDGVVFEREPRHFADDGLGELLGFCGEHLSRDLRHGGVRCSHRMSVRAKV